MFQRINHQLQLLTANFTPTAIWQRIPTRSTTLKRPTSLKTNSKHSHQINVCTWMKLAHKNVNTIGEIRGTSPRSSDREDRLVHITHPMTKMNQNDTFVFTTALITRSIQNIVRISVHFQANLESSFEKLWKPWNQNVVLLGWKLSPVVFYH